MASLIGSLIGYSVIPVIIVCVSVSKVKKGKPFKIPYIIGIVLAVFATIGTYAQASAGGNFGLEDILEIVLFWLILIIGLIILIPMSKKIKQTVVEEDNKEETQL